jgi:hypothetical protein
MNKATKKIVEIESRSFTVSSKLLVSSISVMFTNSHYFHVCYSALVRINEELLERKVAVPA